MKRLLTIGGTLVLLFGIFTLGLVVGFQNQPPVQKVASLFNKEAGKPPTVDFSPFWRTWEIISEKYVAPDNDTSAAVSDQEKVWGAVSGLVASLRDPYSAFLPPEENKMLEEEISGQFGGVGLEIEKKDETLVVVAPLAGTPAQKAGLLPGDIIIQINKTPVERLTTLEAIRQIRGPIGTSVALKVLRGESERSLDFTLIREMIAVPTLETKLLPNQVFLIKLHNFGATAPALFRQALRQWSKTDTNKLIIDVRSNPGGLLNSAVELASWLLPRGTPIVQEVKRDSGDRQVYRSRGYPLGQPKPQLVILINRGSASAAEIFAGALAEHGLATLVGEKTFGKGSVQELLPVTEETALKLTVARWLTPKGVSLSEEGLTPDIAVALTEADRKNNRDPQLDKARELLS